MSRNYLLLLLFIAALTVTVLMALLPHPPAVPGNPADKLQHMAAFTVLSVFGSLAFPRMPLARLGERLSFLGAIIEVLQSMPILGRDCDIKDWIADTAAIMITLGIVWLVRHQRSGQRYERGT